MRLTDDGRGRRCTGHIGLVSDSLEDIIGECGSSYKQAKKQSSNISIVQSYLGVQRGRKAEQNCIPSLRKSGISSSNIFRMFSVVSSCRNKAST